MLTGKDYAEIIFALVLIAGVFVSLTPQIKNVVKSKSTAGISFTTLYLGNIGSFFTATNSLLLNFQYLRCGVVGGLVCGKKILLLFQLISLWLMYVVNYVIYGIYFKDDDGKPVGSELVATPKDSFPPVSDDYLNLDGSHANIPENPNNRMDSKQWKIILASTAFYVYIFIQVVLIAIIICVVFGVVDLRVQLFADVLGYITAGITVIQWAPQIIQTIRSKSSGSFSIVMMLVMMPGSFVILFYLAYLSGERFSTWFSYLVAGIQQIILLACIVYFDYIHPRLGGKSFKSLFKKDKNAAEPTEETSLVV